MLNELMMVEQVRVFTNRKEAGEALGDMLLSYKDRNALVLGIPRGGVEVAYHVGKKLNGQLAAVVTKKLTHPSYEELGIGSVAEDGSAYLTDMGSGFNESELHDIITRQHEEIKSRVQRFRDGKPLPDMEGRVVIVVDDGIATGSTIVPALDLCKKNGAAKIVVASPVAGTNLVPAIASRADEVIVAEQPDNFLGVGQVYADFHGLSDREVVALLAEYEV